jgi:hypothetical protein
VAFSGKPAWSPPMEMRMVVAPRGQALRLTSHRRAREA